eukprot:CAMPEP_0174311060 /NCGR_PEP_ID=MMETSP0810-20121108/3475_1 /TAXON_ID=73025 ORGANISM="Eutreptiella gymnastica-like, Strain CCMP1594" /NCGR_SAMPLE_ID=MMETSP0810 /ASSEMBLY_ACC=CAM_ASM_000659 /LENGTH=160 /DNA_ID=CAMNT_0015419201 /DNA_START=103 /DNA_END=585 /DNA_ORIENTATION=-
MAIRQSTGVIHIVESTAAESTVHLYARDDNGYHQSQKFVLPFAPDHICIQDSNNTLVLLSADNAQIKFISLDDGSTTQTFAFGRACLEDPRGVDVTPEGYLVVTDKKAVRIVDTTGFPKHAFPAEVSTVLNWLPDPRAVAVGRDGRIIVTDPCREAVFVC